MQHCTAAAQKPFSVNTPTALKRAALEVSKAAALRCSSKRAALRLKTSKRETCWSGGTLLCNDELSENKSCWLLIYCSSLHQIRWIHIHTADWWRENAVIIDYRYAAFASHSRRIRVASASHPRRIRVASASHPRRIRVASASHPRRICIAFASHLHRICILHSHSHLSIFSYVKKTWDSNPLFPSEKI